MQRICWQLMGWHVSTQFENNDPKAGTDTLSTLVYGRLVTRNERHNTQFCENKGNPKPNAASYPM